MKLFQKVPDKFWCSLAAGWCDMPPFNSKVKPCNASCQFVLYKKSGVQISCLLPWNGPLHIMYLHMSSTDLQFALLHYRAMHGHAISAFLEALEVCFFLVFFQLKSSLLCPTQWSTYHTHTYMHTQALTSGWKHKLWVCAFMHLYVDVAVCVVCNLSGRKGKTKLKLKNLRKNL